MKKHKVLIVEDEISLRKSLQKLLELKGYGVYEAENFTSAAQKILHNHYDVVLLDLRLPDGNGLQLLKKFRNKIEGKTIIITAHATIQSAVEAVKNGAYYYIEKPLNEDLLFIQMEKITEMIQMKEKNLSFRQEIISGHSTDNIVYRSQKMKEVVSLAKKFSATDNSVLLQGHTGVGKEIIAQFIHKNSKRKNNAFLPINCSSIPEHLFESELFGFKKGAFTGATENYSGRFIQADNGTLFLDEIGEIPIHLQAKLLRVLDDEAIYQLGNKNPVKINVRIIAATNKDLWQEVEADRFRKDLYFRLKEAMIYIPPLKERTEDIMPLLWHFIGIFNNVYEKKITRITTEAEKYLIQYPWEGNVRELKNIIKNIFSLKENDSITINDLVILLHTNTNAAENEFISLEEHELGYIHQVLEAHQFNIKKTAETLNISRSRLYRKVEKLELDRELCE
jgi:DNA-binding NtrC family response regulator